MNNYLIEYLNEKYVDTPIRIINNKYFDVMKYLMY